MKYQMLSFEEAMKLGFKDEDLTEWYDHEYMNGVFLMEDDVPVKLLGSDGGEPEDQKLYRDWAWVTPALNEAYEAGKNEGK